jgi:hypothetical protein
MRHACRAAGALGLVALGADALSAQGEVDAKRYVIPDAPAFTYLGAAPTSIARPSAARDLALAVAEGIDSTGRARRGLAIDVVPWLLFPKRVTNEGYRTRLGDFVYANTQLSLGTTRSTGDSASTDLAIGLKTNLANGADPLRDAALGERIDAAVLECRRSSRGPDGRPDGALLEACADRAVGDSVARWLDEDGHWNDVALTVASAFGARLSESRIDQVRGRGGAVWATLALPVGARFGQLLVQGRGDVVRGGGRGARDTTAFSGGARLGVGATSVNGFVELVGSWRNLGDERATQQWSSGVELRVAEALWLSTGFGSRYDALTRGNRAVLLANVRWNTTSAPQLVAR